MPMGGVPKLPSLLMIEGLICRVKGHEGGPTSSRSMIIWLGMPHVRL
jgi:hypothetical protein